MSDRSTSLRIGIVGAGWMGGQHAAFVSSNPSTCLTAVADPTTSAVADAHGARSFTDHRTMIAAGGLDAVIVANPNDLHVPTALDCIRAGLPTLVEKPIGSSLPEVRELVHEATAVDVPVLVGHHRRYHPNIQQAKRLIESGELGRIIAVTCLAQVKKPERYFDVAWRSTPGSGGVVLINLIHDFDMMRYLVGELDQVAALLSSDVREFPVEDTVAVNLRFAHGALGTLTASDSTAAPWSWEQSSGEPAFALQPEEPCLLIAGTAGSVSIPQLGVWTYGAEAGWHEPLRHRFENRPAGVAGAAQLAHFVDVAQGQAEPLVGAADAARNLALVEATYESAAVSALVQPQQI